MKIIDKRPLKSKVIDKEVFEDKDKKPVEVKDKKPVEVKDKKPVEIKDKKSLDKKEDFFLVSSGLALWEVVELGFQVL